MPRPDRIGLWLLTSVFCGFACQVGGAKFPWGEPGKTPVVEHADVHTLNLDYRRTRSQVLVRTIRGPTRAALDYAAYHANFMIADPEPETPIAPGVPDTSHPFAGKIAAPSLTSDFAKVPLSERERLHPLAYAPLSEFLQARKVDGAPALAEVGAAVREEKWGLTVPPGSAGQTLAELYVHSPANGPAELWAKIEFQPWFTPFSKSPDQDADGFPEIYGRVSNAASGKVLIDAIKDQYEAPILSAKDLKSWANQLASYWYPSFNTDLIPVDSRWPNDQTESNIKRELAGRHFDAPAIVMRGKPQGKPTYDVFLIASEGAPATAPVSTLKLEKTRPTPKPEPVLHAILAELAGEGGGSWEKWAAQLAPFRDTVRKRLKSMPRGSKALAGQNGFLFYKNSLEYAAGGDLEAQRKGKNPLPIIVEFKKELDQQGVDFLFVPVPTKLDIYPEQLASDVHLPEGRVINPFFRKFLASLAKEGVEVVDLLPSFLKAKAESSSAGEALFQHQDTHWTDRGLRLAAEQLSLRVKAYPWYGELTKHAQSFTVHGTSFTRFGDLQSRLPQAEQKNYTPETLAAEQVLRKDGQPYDDDPDSPIVLLGDSFSGVYELTDAEHAGVSAHIARGISYPLDLVMSYGGGPNVRQKLLRRGEAALGDKKLVIWLMTARDLYNYWEDWEPLKKP
jgi:hypothetical protein